MTPPPPPHVPPTSPPADRPGVATRWPSPRLPGRPAWIGAPRRTLPMPAAQDDPVSRLRGHAPVQVSVASRGRPWPQPPELSAVIVVRNDLARLVPCLEALIEATSHRETQIVVVDAGSTDRTTSTLIGDFPQVTLVRTATDLGPAWSTDIGLARCEGPTLLVVDPGARPTELAVRALTRHLAAHERCALCASALCDGDGAPLPGPAPRPTLRHLLVEESGLARLWPDNPWRRQLPARAVGGIIDGAPPRGLLALRREALDDVGPLDTDLPWHEHHLDWVRRLARAGWETHVVDTPAVVHVPGTPPDGEDPWRRHRDRIRYARKHHGPWGVRCASLSLWSWALVEAGARVAGRGEPRDRGVFGAFEALARARRVRAMA